MSQRFSRWGAPATYITAVLIVGLSLIAILGRSPDTKSNFQDAPEDYDRTELSVIGVEDQFEGLVLELGSAPQEIYIGAGCASCHGLNGEGGVVGPDIWGKNFEDMLEAVREGEHGMPEFAGERLTDEQVEALARYLNDLREVAQRESGSTR